MAVENPGKQEIMNELLKQESPPNTILLNSACDVNDVTGKFNILNKSSWVLQHSVAYSSF